MKYEIEVQFDVHNPGAELTTTVLLDEGIIWDEWEEKDSQPFIGKHHKGSWSRYPTSKIIALEEDHGEDLPVTVAHLYDVKEWPLPQGQRGTGYIRVPEYYGDRSINWEVKRRY